MSGHPDPSLAPEAGPGLQPAAAGAEAIALAERVLAILEEGSFAPTYKFALFTALLDLCIEKTTRDGPPSFITTRELAEKVVELYWNHVRDFRASVGDAVPRLLRQGGNNRGQEAEIIRAIRRTRGLWSDDRADTPFRMRLARPREFDRLLDVIEWKLIEMPIPRLQVLGRQEERFLYEYNWTQAIRRSELSAYPPRRRHRRRPLPALGAICRRWAGQPGGGAPEVQQQQARLPGVGRARRALARAVAASWGRPGAHC